MSWNHIVDGALGRTWRVVRLLMVLCLAPIPLGMRVGSARAMPSATPTSHVSKSASAFGFWSPRGLSYALRQRERVSRLNGIKAGRMEARLRAIGHIDRPAAQTLLPSVQRHFC